MPCIIKEISTFYSEIFRVIFLALNIIHLNFINNSDNNTNSLQIGENKIVNQGNNYFQLFDDFEENMDDEIAKNSFANPWRKDYFDFLENRISKSETNELSNNIK